MSALVALARKRRGRELGGRRRAVRTGAEPMTCTIADIEAFLEACQIPLYPGKWNTWLLLRTLTDEPEIGQVEATARAVLRWWFKSSATWPGLTRGDVDNFELVVGEAQDPSTTPTPPVSPWGDRSRSAHRQDCDQFMTLKPGAYIPIWVRFVYRGQAQRMGWPVRRVFFPGIAISCPIEADWLLDSVYEPIADEEIPEPTPGLPGLPDVPAPDLKPIGEAVAKVGKTIGWILAALAAVFVYGVSRR